MNEPIRTNFPQWMLEQPWDTLVSYITDAREAAVQAKLTTHLLRTDPQVARSRVHSPMLDRTHTVEDLTSEINAQLDSLLQTIESLAEFRAAVMQQAQMREHSD